MKIYLFIAEEQANHSIWTISEMCRVLEVSRSGFYDWHGRGPSERELSDRRLAIEIEAIWECSDRTYGSPRVHRWLLKQRFVVGHNRVARIMAVNGWEGETGRRKVRTTIVDRGATAAQDRVKARTSIRPRRTRSGAATSPTCAPVKAGSTWPPSLICTRGE